MARKPSVILTPAEKKLAVGNAKETVKAAKVDLSNAIKARKQLDNEYNKAIKLNDKLTTAAEKALLKAENDLLKVVPAKAVPSPVGE